MPVDFLTPEHKQRYGRYVGEPSDEQLTRYFHLDDNDFSQINRRRGDHNRYGFSLQLTTVRFLGTFLDDPTEVPQTVKWAIAHQLGLGELPDLSSYRHDLTHWRHANEIKRHYGYREFNDRSEYFRLVRWLYSRAWISEERPTMLFDLATARLVERKILLPGVTVLSRLVARVRERAAQRLWRTLSEKPTALQRACLEGLLVIPEGARQSPLDRLRQGPRRISGPALLSALERLQEIRALSVGDIDISAYSPSRIQAMAKLAGKAKAFVVARMSEHRRIATLLAFAKTYERYALDDVLDIFDARISELLKEAKRSGEKSRLRSLRDLDAAALDLRKACEVLLDTSLNETEVRETVFERISAVRLQQAANRVAELARPDDDRYQQEMIEQYRRIQRFLPKLLRNVRFEGTPAGQATVKMLEFLTAIDGRRRPDLSKAPLEDTSSAWRRWIIDDNGSVNRAAYTLCAMEKLQEGLQHRDVFVSPSDRWSDPRLKLLHGAKWESLRPQICRSLELPEKPDPAVATLSQQLHTAYEQTLAHLPHNTAVRFEGEPGREELVISNLDKLEEPDSLVALREQIAERLPPIDLPEVLLEVHQWTGFADQFTHISEGKSRATDLAVSVCAALMAEACNTGLEPLIKPNHPALTRDRLSWVLHNYIRIDTLIRSNARLVDYQSTLALAQQWGGGEVASADGLRFVVPVRSANTGPNRKYFGSERGITYYNFSSDQFTGFHGIVIPGTLRDSLYILEGLLEHQTHLPVKELMTDTAGSSDIIFGLFWLLGFQFSPRLADIGGTRFWRTDPDADYGVLDYLSRHRVSIERICRHWDDMLRVAASLKTGTISASELMRTLLRSQKPSALARAIADLGRIPKTIHLLRIIDDELYRRRILLRLNHGESRHSLGREVFHGHRGQIRQQYREGQENQLGALGLVVNALILWNTVYIEAAINQLREEGFPVHPEDVTRLSPLSYGHFNFLGRYSFALAEAVVKGQLRPLREPTTLIQRVA